MNLLKQFFGNAPPRINAETAHEKLNRRSAPLVIDVRQPVEYQSGHIAGAKLIPLDDLPEKMGQLPKDRPIIAVCHSGRRSRRAAHILSRAGYEVENLGGGMIAWEMAGFPIKKGNGTK